VNVSGKLQLKLVVADGLDGIDYDHADWADAKLNCGGSPPPPGDTVSPTVVGTVPFPGATNVGISTAISATMSEPIQPSGATSGNVVLTDSQQAVVSATVSYDTATRTVRLQPASLLRAFTFYTVRIKGGPTGIKDMAGNPLASDASWTFVTGP
jgi:hypothetical protein